MKQGTSANQKKSDKRNDEAGISSLTEADHIGAILLRSTIESYEDVLIFYIDREYRYLVFNSAFGDATFAAYGSKVKMGLSMLDSITVEADRRKAKENCDRALAGNNHVTVEVYGEITLSYFETRYYPVRDEHNNVIGVAVMSSNVTARELARLKIEELIKDLEAFSYSVSHDLKAPLRAIGVFSDILLEKYNGSLDARGMKYLAMIQGNIQKMNTIIDDLMKFARVGKGEISESNVDMNSLVRESIRVLTQEKPAKSQIINTGKLPKAICDAGLMKQVYQNLISNALKFSSKRGIPNIEIGSKIDKGRVVYYVKDNGVGFDMKHSSKLFTVFERLHSQEEFEGSGIGLALAGRIIKRHNGRIWAESKPGEGASFYFSLPHRINKEGKPTR